MTCGRQLQLDGGVVRGACGVRLRALEAHDLRRDRGDLALHVVGLRLRAQLGELLLETCDRPVGRVHLRAEVLDVDVLADHCPERGQTRDRGLDVRARNAEHEVGRAARALRVDVHAHGVAAERGHDPLRARRRNRHAVRGRDAELEGRGIALRPVARGRDRQGAAATDRSSFVRGSAEGRLMPGRRGGAEPIESGGRELRHSGLVLAAAGDRDDGGCDRGNRGHEDERGALPRDAAVGRSRLRGDEAHALAELLGRGRPRLAQLGDQVTLRHRAPPRASSTRG